MYRPLLPIIIWFEIAFCGRQINGTVVEDAEMDGFLGYLQSQQKVAIDEKELDLHIYSSRDVDM